MRSSRKLVQFATGTVAALAMGAAHADTAGKAEYMNACVACHGVDADGQGPMVELISMRIPDLTGLAARNDGVFPMLEVIHVIDGRTGMRAHGSGMPL